MTTKAGRTDPTEPGPVLGCAQTDRLLYYVPIPVDIFINAFSSLLVDTGPLSLPLVVKPKEW